jgi:glycosyltransferase involved in cell wall biosynthesis
MGRKILLISPVSLFPTIMASQDRIINLALNLSKNHEVDLILPYYNLSEHTVAKSKLNWLSGDIFFVRYPNYSTLRKKTFGLIKKATHLFIPQIDEIFYPTWPTVINSIYRIIAKNSYDIIQLEYWYQGLILPRIPKGILKVIDTHNVLFEKRMLEMNMLEHSTWSEKLVKKYKTLEMQAYQNADILISISPLDYQFFTSRFLQKKHIIIPTGQDLKKFMEYSTPVPEEDIVLFYGSMGGEQNTHAFWRLFERIFPRIKSKIPAVKLLVVGANPPKNIMALNKLDYVNIVGYVEDLSLALSKAKIMILPMEISGGFRSRVVEVMALGIPIIGTSNALDNIGFENKKHGFIADSDEEMAQIAINLLSDDKIRVETGENCKQFCFENFSIEATYDKLAQYYDSF